MPTLRELPAAQPLGATDIIPIQQAYTDPVTGAARDVTSGITPTELLDGMLGGSVAFGTLFSVWAASLPKTNSPGVLPAGVVAGDWYMDNGMLCQVQP